MQGQQWNKLKPVNAGRIITLMGSFLVRVNAITLRHTRSFFYERCHFQTLNDQLERTSITHIAVPKPKKNAVFVECRKKTPKT